jgi:uncharacterized membrane protein
MTTVDKSVIDKTRVAWQITAVLYGCLLIFLTLEHTLVRQAFFWPVFLMQTVPLLLVLPGLWQRHARSGIWLCFMILFHFLSAIEKIFQSVNTHNGDVLFYSSMIAIILSLFISSLLFVRWQAKA